MTTNKQLTLEQLQQFRNHAEQYPVGDTAKLLSHIDWINSEIDRLVSLWENEFGYSELELIMSLKNLAEGGG